VRCNLLFAQFAAKQAPSGNSSGFVRLAPYQYLTCASQPGTINSTSGSSACIPIDPGALTFCVSVAYTACLRVADPTQYDLTVSKAFAARLARWNVEFPSTTPTCLAAFKAYVCALSFPQCIQNPNNATQPPVQQPVCFSYCQAAEKACGVASDLTTFACNKAAASSQVAPNRPDVTCFSRASRLAALSSVIAVALLVLMME